MGKFPDSVEDFPRRISVFVMLLAFLMIVGTISYKFLLNISFNDSFIRTLETLAFLFHPEGGGVIRAFNLFLSLFGVILIWWALWGVFDLLLDGNLSKYLKIRRHLSKLRRMKNHYVIAGGGRVGQEIARKLKEEKKEYLIIERDDSTVDRLKRSGFTAVKGDVSDEDVLSEHNISKAKALILTLPETEKNILVTLTAKEIFPELYIYARADKPNCINKLKKAGADFVIVPELAAAEKMLYEIFIRDKKK